MSTKNLIKILHTISVKNLTGAAQPLFLLLKEFNAGGETDVSVLSPISKGNIVQRICDEGFHHRKEVDLSPGQSPISLVMQAVKMSRLIDSEGIDIIHSHLSHDNWISSFASKLSVKKPPVIRTLHNSRSTEKRTDYGILYKNMTSRLICISEILREKLIKNYPSLLSKTVVIHASVEGNKFNQNIPPERFLDKYGIRKDDGIIGMVARFKKGRGHRTLIESFSKILKTFPKAKLILAGKGEEKEKMEKLSESMELRESVIFTGYLKSELSEAYRAMTAACVLEEGNDGSMRTILEAMSCGIPVISMDRGSASEIINHGRTGFIAKDTNDLQNYISCLLKDKKLSEKIGKEAASFISKNYIPSAEAEKHLDIYRKIINSQKSF